MYVSIHSTNLKYNKNNQFSVPATSAQSHIQHNNNYIQSVLECRNQSQHSDLNKVDCDTKNEVIFLC